MLSWLDALLRDGRHALRRLRQEWTLAVAAILILGLGIGANTAIFSVVNAALLRQPTYGSLDRLVDIYQNASNPGGMDANSYPAYLDIAAYTDVFADMTAILGILALRAAVAPAPGISLYRPTADPAALATIAGFMAEVGIAAASLPAWGAVRMDPVGALRHE